MVACSIIFTFIKKHRIQIYSDYVREVRDSAEMAAGVLNIADELKNMFTRNEERINKDGSNPVT